MTILNVRVSDDMPARFDAWAAERGGRSPALRHLIDRACRTGPTAPVAPGRHASRPVKLTVRLSAADGRGLDAAAAGMGLTRNAWAAAVIRRRLHGRPT